MSETTVKKENIMGSLPVRQLLVKMSVPVILSMLVSTLYNVVDSIFVSRLGDSALTAMSLGTPVSSLIACVTVGFSVGMNAVLSKRLGEGDRNAADKAAGNGLLIEWICFAVFFLFGLFAVRAYYSFQTDIEEIRELGVQYTSIICLFSFGVANQVMLERMLVATGRSIGSMYSLLTGTLVNLILDPILIFGLFGLPALGMRGAAIATVAAQHAAALVGLIFNLKTNKEIHFSKNMFLPDGGIMKGIFKVGFPAALQQSISPMLIFGMNQILLQFTAAAPAVYVIYVRLQSIVLIPVWGLKNTVVSIISYNYGAGYKERILETMKICTVATAVITLVGLSVFQLMPQALLSMFNAQGEVLDIGIRALRIVSFVFPFSGMTLLFGAFFQALGHSTKTLLISLMQLGIMLASAVLLARTGTVYTVWFAFIITEVTVAGIAAMFLLYVNRSVIAYMKPAL
ncbi:MAG: MATE family efflux transporter, partial [Solobacterium sp.]|nr:MATE family efflux transporter [Solobacterium sp.]